MTVAPAATSQGTPGDRSLGLVVFGVLQAGIGVVCALIALAVGAAMSLVPGDVQAMPARSLGPTLFLYGAAASYFVSVGIGSMRKRRWARALSAAVGAIWLVSGIVGAAVTFIITPKLLVMVPRSGEKAFIAVLRTFVLVFFVALPLLVFLFYKSDRTRQTCELRDPRVRWTDRVPLPVLALSIVFAFAAVSLLVSLSNPVLPVMGSILTGGPAAITVLAFAGLCAFLAVQLYRLKESAWWTLILLQVIGGIVTAITMARIDVNAVWARAGLLTPQVEAMKLQEVYRNPLLWAVLIAAWVAYLAFLISLRRYFVGSGPRTRAGE